MYLCGRAQLFMGLFLHQTTTEFFDDLCTNELFMGLFLHQTTTMYSAVTLLPCCLWVFSYIKPQLYRLCISASCRCLWVFSYIKPQQRAQHISKALRCLWVFSYIKPQQDRADIEKEFVVYGSFPTSNHNRQRLRLLQRRLFMGLFLHQTTTLSMYRSANGRCLWVFSYIKPQRTHSCPFLSVSCLWVFSYIKPQLKTSQVYIRKVVYGSFPTSNHNTWSAVVEVALLFMGLFLHQTTT